MRLVPCLLLACMAAAAAEPLELGVMTFNIRYGTALDGANAWPQRRDMLVRCIQRHDPDIVGLQECLDFQAEFLVDVLPHYRRIGIDRDASGKGESTTLLYRHDSLLPVESANFWLSETPEIPASVSWDSSLTRIATWVRFYHTGAKRFFYALNTHFDHRGETARAKSAELIAQRIAAMRPGEPVIVTGDFNTNAEDTPPWTTLAAAGLADAWLAAAERIGPAGTWCGFKAPVPEARNRIDWVLFRGPAAVVRCETVVYEEDGRYPSDHFPVAARLRFE